jgi:hypothetical protein
MPCNTCQNFPSHSSRFQELGVSLERHGTLYHWKDCGTLFELIAEERSVRFTPPDELKRHYPEAVHE